MESDFGWLSIRSMLLPYTAHELPSNEVFSEGLVAQRPIILISLNNGGQSTEPFEAMIDTGSDFCVFPSLLLDDLGLSWNELRSAPAMTHAGDVEFRYTEIGASVRGLRDWNLIAGFSIRPCIPALGMIGFLDQFKVTFDRKNGYFSIDP